MKNHETQRQIEAFENEGGAVHEKPKVVADEAIGDYRTEPTKQPLSTPWRDRLRRLLAKEEEQR